NTTYAFRLKLKPVQHKFYVFILLCTSSILVVETVKKSIQMKIGYSTNDLTRNNHYVPQWYQKGFVVNAAHLHYLDLTPEARILPDGRTFKFNERRTMPPSQCFFKVDLYTTFFGPFI